MKAQVQIRLDNERLDPSNADRGAHSPRRVGARAFVDGLAQSPIGGVRRSGAGRELGRNAAADYTEHKTFHVYNRPHGVWPLGSKLST